MCFSAQASFTTSAALLPAGIYCIRRAVAEDRNYLPLSIIPAVFGVQQFCEGLVWVGLGRGDPLLARVASLTFLFFALVFWPFWIPLSARFLETRSSVKQALGFLAAAALVLSLLVFVPLVVHAPEWLHSGILYHSIRYEFRLPSAFRAIPMEAWQLAYLAVVITPLLVAGNRKFRIFGVLVLASAGLSHAAFWYAYISVWCAFSAVLSAWLCYLFYALRAVPGPRSGPEPRQIPALNLN